MVMFCVSFDFGVSKDTFIHAKFRLWDLGREGVSFAQSCVARSCAVLVGRKLERGGVRKGGI